MNKILLCSVLLIALHACQEPGSHNGKSSEAPPMFTRISAQQSGVYFNNEVDPEKVKSPMEYINVYNGGGVAAGDINNDGLPDLFFTGNVVNNRLYLNQGNFHFEDITEKAGVAAPESWCTGVTMTDVNQDGWLDIYVCRTYDDNPFQRSNLLYLNNGDLTFTEKAADYRIADTGYSISATFLDYNKDGHPDLYVGNHPLDRIRKTFLEHIQNWKNPTPQFSDKLYKNNGDGTFTDVTQQAGVLNYCWTLGVVAADLNEDGWTDLYVAADHTEPDRYYQNNGDGTFSEVSSHKLDHMSHSSMGVDAADINNDGLLDLVVVEMLATNNFDEKTNMPSMNPERFWAFVDVGYHYQYMRNMLQLNTGDGHFSEIAQMAGIHRTNWSWASLLADFDNDGFKDLFVSNGYLRMYNDKDHHKKFLKTFEELIKQGQELPKSLIKDYGVKAPEARQENNFFHNNGNLTFTEVGPEVGLNFKGLSSGATYADLDNDGDLDLVVTNTNDPALIYKNENREQDGNHFFRVALKHPPTVCPIGTKMFIETDKGIQHQEFTYTRGYQSSVEPVVHFGLGKEAAIHKLVVQWPDGQYQEIPNPVINQVMEVHYEQAVPGKGMANQPKSYLFAEVTGSSGINWKHEETIFDDYKKQVLLPHKMSQFGPFLASADVNGDGLEDFYAGGGNGQPGALFFQNPDGTFRKADHPAFEIDRNCEDMGAAFIDANNDGLMDLYVASGGNEFPEESEMLRDRLYINVGQGVLQKVRNAIPDIRISSSCVVPFDFDRDGDVDLFVGGRQVPGRYPSPANSILLENDRGFFVDATQSKAPGFKELGMVTDALWNDLDKDGDADLLLCGEWMPLTVFTQNGGQFTNSTEAFGLADTNGWWFSLAQGDFDKDGDIDFLGGNLGFNYKYKASEEKPFHIYASDFDNNGTFDIALGYYLEGKDLYPVRGRQCSSEQVPAIAEKFPTYKEFGKATLFDVYGEKLNEALHYEVKSFASVFIRNNGGSFTLSPLPNEAQIAPVNAMVVEDFDNDGQLDVVLGGNLFVSEVETGRADAGKGLFLKGNGDGSFKPFNVYQSGLMIPGDVKDIIPLVAGGKRLLLVSNNNGPLQVFACKSGKISSSLSFK